MIDYIIYRFGGIETKLEKTVIIIKKDYIIYRFGGIETENFSPKIFSNFFSITLSTASAVLRHSNVGTATAGADYIIYRFGGIETFSIFFVMSPRC